MDTNAVLTSFEILNNVNAFYDTSWNHLLLFSGALAVVIGIIVPLLIQYYQTRLFRIEEDNIQRRINDKTTEVKNSLAEQQSLEFQNMRERIKEEHTQLDKKISASLADLEKSSAAQMKQLKEETAKQIQQTKGNIYHVQAQVLASKGSFPGAVESMLTALVSEAQSGDERNLQRGITTLTTKYLLKVTKTQWDNNPEIKSLGDLLLEHLSAMNENERYTEAMDDLKKAFSQASNRKSEA